MHGWWLTAALIVANNSAGARGLLPPSTCKQDNPNEVTCTAPVAGISGAVFQTYPSLKALWTQDDGHLLCYVVGPLHQDVYAWWVAVHHNIGLGGSPINMNAGAGGGA